jgi:prevent-host-death family protein
MLAKASPTDQNKIWETKMIDERINIAEAKKHFSELVGQVAYGGKHILITKRGRPIARLIPADEVDVHLGDAKGWLEDNDPFFDAIDRIVKNRLLFDK